MSNKLNLFHFLIKGLIRDHHRSLFPIIMVSTGVFLAVLLHAWMHGVVNDLVRTNAVFGTGHVKIVTRAYNEIKDQLPNDLAILNTHELLKKLEDDNPYNLTYTPRIRFTGLLDIPDKNNETLNQAPVTGLGIDILGKGYDSEHVLKLQDALIEGTLPQKTNEILITKQFAKKLNVELNSVVTIISSTMYGSMVIHNFKVVGMLHFGMTAVDRSTIIIDIENIRVVLDMQDGSSEILGFAPNMFYDAKAMKDLKTHFNNKYSSVDEFSPIMLTLGEQNELEEYLMLAESMSFVLVSIFMVAMFIVLWNSFLINGLRRYGEVGVRLAIGEPKYGLIKTLVYESCVIGIIGSIIGTILGLALSYYLQYKGYNIESMLQKSTMLISSEMRTKVTFACYYIGFIPGIIAPILGTIVASIGILKRKTSQLFRELELEG